MPTCPADQGPVESGHQHPQGIQHRPAGHVQDQLIRLIAQHVRPLTVALSFLMACYSINESSKRCIVFNLNNNLILLHFFRNWVNTINNRPFTKFTLFIKL